MFSVIFVPIIVAALLVALYLLLSPRRRQDAPAAAQYQLRRATDFIDAKMEKPTKRDYKRLDLTVNRAKGFIDRARLEDVYDMSLPYAEADKAREITQALTLALPSDPSPYLARVKRHLSAASSYITAYCGVSDDAAHKMSLAVFDKKARAEKAKRFLNELDDEK